MAATFGDAEVDRAGGWCVTGDERVGEWRRVVWGSSKGHRDLGGLWRWWMKKEATKLGLGGCFCVVALMRSPLGHLLVVLA